MAKKSVRYRDVRTVELWRELAQAIVERDEARSKLDDVWHLADGLKDDADRERNRADQLREGMKEIAAHDCSGIGSPPSCACRTCIARRALEASDLLSEGDAQ